MIARPDDQAACLPTASLAATPSADVARYSGSLDTTSGQPLKGLVLYRRLGRDRVQCHVDRVVDSPGDALLAEFGSTMEAVECADEIHRELGKRNGHSSPSTGKIFGSASKNYVFTQRRSKPAIHGLQTLRTFRPFQSFQKSLNLGALSCVYRTVF